MTGTQEVAFGEQSVSGDDRAGARSHEELVEAHGVLQLENGRLTVELAELRAQVEALRSAQLAATCAHSQGSVNSAEPDGSTASTPPPSPAIATRKYTFDPGRVVASLIELSGKGFGNEAQLYARCSVRATPRSPRRHMRWVKELRYRRELGLAMDLCNACFGADGDTPLIRLNRGYLLYEAGHYQGAAEDLEIAAAFRPDSVEEKLVAASARGRLNQAGQPAQTDLLAGFFHAAEATFRADGFEPEALKRSLERYGCAWIQGLLDTDELTRFHQVIEANREGISEVYRDLGAPASVVAEGLPLYFVAERNREKAQACFQNSYPALFDPARMSGVDNQPLPRFVFAALRRTALDQVLRQVLRMSRLQTSAAVCSIRHITPAGARSRSELRQSNRLYASDAEILTLWFPLSCAHGSAPGLEVVPIRCDSHLPCTSASGIDSDLFEPAVLWRPPVRPGDAVLLSGLSAHRTCFEADTTLERACVDLRFFAADLPQPIHEESPT